MKPMKTNKSETAGFAGHIQVMFYIRVSFQLSLIMP